MLVILVAIKYNHFRTSVFHLNFRLYFLACWTPLKLI